MWHLLLALLLATFAFHAFLVTGTLQLGSEAQTQRRLTRIGDFWSEQPPLSAPLGLDPVTVVYPGYQHLPPNIQDMLQADARGLFELGNRAQDYFVLARSNAAGEAFYVVEFHSEVKPNETIQYQVFIWYLMGAIPFGVLLLWLCKRITARVAAPMREVGRQIADRPPGSLDPLALPPGAPVELEALVTQMNSALQRTTNVLERERRFTEFASHELRTPAAVIQAALERLEAQDKPELKPPMERARRGLRDMHALIDTFLQLSGDRVGSPEQAPVCVDRVWVAALFDHVAGGHADRPIVIDEEAPLLLAAPTTMVHVLIANLLKNALFHGGPEPIAVRIAADRFEVRNSLPNAGTEAGAARGHGLGVQIVHRICARLGWTFTLTLAEGVALACLQVPRNDNDNDNDNGNGNDIDHDNGMA